MQRATLGLLVLLPAVFAGAGVSAQSNIEPANSFAWGENVGWTNWQEANGGLDGVRVEATFLGGFVWCENAGWLNLGDGTPGAGTSYANVNGTDFGVNIAPDGTLDGFGWGENIGWVNFDTSSLGANRARFDAVASRFRGYAWGENVGWINLDDATSFVGVIPSGPANDDCIDAEVIASGVATPFDTTFANADGPTPSCGGGTAPIDIWYAYTADCNGVALASTCGSAFDTRLAVYSSTACPASGQIACNDDSCGLQSEVHFPVTAGTTYLVQVAGFNGATGSGTLIITCNLTPSNDGCANAAPIADGVTDFDTTFATTDGLGIDPMTCSQWAGVDPILHNDVWFVYTASANSMVTVTTCDIGVIDTRLAVWDASVPCPPDPGVDTPVACQDDEAGCSNFTSRVDFMAATGQTYRIQVGGFGAGVAGAGQLEITSVTTDPGFRRGDCNADGAFNIADAVFALSTLFPPQGGPPAIQCNDACDSNDDGQLNIADAVAALAELFPGPSGPSPLPPPGSSACGVDPTSDALDCVNYTNCP
ncbi:MAG: hypothetical protein AB7O52_10950 [Planctomycetota bacterium]